MLDELLAVDNTELEYTKGCQDPFTSQDPFDEAIKLLAGVCDSNIERNKSIDDKHKEDSNVTHASQSRANDTFHSSYMTPAPAATAAQSASTIFEQTAEVANDKQEWEICDIIGKEDVDGVPHYWVQWSATLVPKYDMGKARALVARFEAGLRAQHKQKGGKGRGRLLPSKADKQAAARVRATGQAQEKKRRGRPRKQE
jgi:hypothetical protein